VTSRNEKAFLSLFQPGASHRDAALAYASYDLYVHPLKPNSKQPVLAAWQKRATTDFDQIKSWWAEGSARNIAIYLRASQVVVIDVDSIKGGDETFKQLVATYGPLPPTYTVKTANGGLHFYYRVYGDFYTQDYPKFLGPAVEFLRTGYVVAPPSELEDGKLYTLVSGNLGAGDFTQLPLSWIESVFAGQGRDTEKAEWHRTEDWFFDKGARNEGATRLAGYYRRIGLSASEIEEHLHSAGRHGRFEAYNEDADFREELATIARSIGNHRPGEINLVETSLTLRKRAHKPLLDDNALIGPLGNFIQYIEPITETHPAALLMQALAVFGNIIGAIDASDPGIGFYVEDRHHKTALYIMIVGYSALAGKGDSWSRIRHLFSLVDSTWQVTNGFQSGESVIVQLEDDEETDLTLVDNTRGNIERGVHRGAKDKRCLCVESEFNRVLSVASRQGNTIKDILRTLWDEGEAAKITASTRQKVTGATFSLIGHITPEELTGKMEEIDLVNGFGNRFLYCYTERTQYLRTDDTWSFTNRELKPFVGPLRTAVRWADAGNAPEDYEFSDDAKFIFDEYFERLFIQGQRSVLSLEDKLSARARPIVRRLAVIYAVSECSDIIELRHVQAALSIWNYCIDSVSYIFSDWTGDKEADKIYTALLQRPSGLTKSQIRTDVFSNNRVNLDRALNVLISKGLIIKTQIDQVGKRKRQVDLYVAIQH
jgi:hypothetical protein